MRQPSTKLNICSNVLPALTFISAVVELFGFVCAPSVAGQPDVRIKSTRRIQVMIQSYTIHLSLLFSWVTLKHSNKNPAEELQLRGETQQAEKQNEVMGTINSVQTNKVIKHFSAFSDNKENLAF